MKKKPLPQPLSHIRWMICRDLDPVLAIEAESFKLPWLEADFIRCLRQRNCIGMVMQVGYGIVGYMVYALNKHDVEVLNFAVDSSCRRRGIGRAMAAKLIAKLHPTRRILVRLRVWETNLDAQLFWRAVGFRAVKVLRGQYRDTEENVYEMHYRLRNTNGRPVTFPCYDRKAESRSP